MMIRAAMIIVLKSLQVHASNFIKSSMIMNLMIVVGLKKIHIDFRLELLFGINKSLSGSLFSLYGTVNSLEAPYTRWGLIPCCCGTDRQRNK